jgi:hypothetical protein
MKFLKIISESKKTDAVKEYSEKFPESESLFEELFSYDPTGYKYIDYIKKWLNVYLKNYEEHFKTGFKPDELFSWFSIIPWFEQNSQRIGINDIAQLYDVAKDMMESSDILGSIPSIDETNKTDINRYHPRILRYLKEIVDSRLTKKDVEKQAKEGAEAVFEKGLVVVVEVKNHAASCYYGAGSKWCTAQKDSPNYFFKETKDYKLYYVIDRSNERPKIAVQEPYKQGNKIIVWTAEDKQMPISYLYETYPEVEEFFDKKFTSGGTFMFLKNALQKRTDFSWSFEYPDPLIYLIQNKYVTIEFNSIDDFFKELFGDVNDYDMALINSIFGNYSGSWDFEDRYNSEEDWDSGYFNTYFFDDEIKKFLKSASILFPTEYPELLEDYKNYNQFRNQFSPTLTSLLRDMFPRQVDDIIDALHYQKNYEKELTVKESLIDEYSNMFSKFGFVPKGHFYRYVVSVPELMMFLLKYSPKGDILSAMKKYIEVSNIDVPYDLQDIAYNANSSMTNEEFNEPIINEISKLNDAMEEKIEELMEDEEFDFKTFEQNSIFLDKILQKYPMDDYTWYVVPRDENKAFKINSFDILENSITILVRNSRTNFIDKVMLSFEDFYNYLYNYQLFDK